MQVTEVLTCVGNNDTEAIKRDAHDAALKLYKTMDFPIMRYRSSTKALKIQQAKRATLKDRRLYSQEHSEDIGREINIRNVV
jgi:bacillopeptidase F (M6 metalloprotease family)